MASKGARHGSVATKSTYPESVLGLLCILPPPVPCIERFAAAYFDMGAD
jgi:hypothetical protein